MSCSDMKYSENFGQTVPGDSTLRMNQTKNRPVERSVASLFCWVTELKFDWLLSCYCTMESYFFEKAFIFPSTCVLAIYSWQIQNWWKILWNCAEEQRYKNALLKIIWTPLLWIAKTSATWRHRIASKSFDAFFQEKGERFRDFSLIKFR